MRCIAINLDDSLSFVLIQHMATPASNLSEDSCNRNRSSIFSRSSSHAPMLLPRLQPPLRAVITSITRPGTQTSLNEAFAQLSIKKPSPVLTFVRHASHAQQGAVNKAKDGPGKRLGAKKSGGTFNFPFLFLCWHGVGANVGCGEGNWEREKWMNGMLTQPKNNMSSQAT